MALSVQRVTLLLAMVIAMFASLAALTSPPAHADRCQPEELLGYNPILPEDLHPVCDALINVVYPYVCEDYTTLAQCTATVNVAGTEDLLNYCAIYCVGTGGFSGDSGDRDRSPLSPVDVTYLTDQFETCVGVPQAGLQTTYYYCAFGDDDILRFGESPKDPFLVIALPDRP